MPYADPEKQRAYQQDWYYRKVRADLPRYCWTLYHNRVRKRARADERDRARLEET